MTCVICKNSDPYKATLTVDEKLMTRIKQKKTEHDDYQRTMGTVINYMYAAYAILISLPFIAISWLWK